MQYISTLLTVTDIKRSRQFYEELLNQEIEYDFGENITFKSGISLHLKDHYKSLLGTGIRIQSRPNNMELYFEEKNIDSFVSSLKKSEVQLIHPLTTQPWGQKVIRFYDPDGHIIETGEPMSAVVSRMIQEGLTDEAIAGKTSLPPEAVTAVRLKSSSNRS